MEAPHEKKIQYRGKKTPKKIQIPVHGIDLTFGADPIWVPANQADWLMENNPIMFHYYGERGGDESPVEDAAAMVAAAKVEDDDDLIDYVEEPAGEPEFVEEPESEPEFVECKCGKQYKNSEKGRFWLAKHVQECEKAKS